jgi:carboxyl-terminal processing protease
MEPTNLKPVTEPNKTPVATKHRKLLSVLFIILVAAGSYRLGYVTGKKGLVFQPKEFKIINQNEQPATVDYNLLWEALRVVQNNYIDKDKIDQRKILYGAVRGAVSAAGDQYTTFFDPDELNNFRTELAGSFDGIGAEVGKKDNNIVIVAPLDDTPAQKAGILANDIIVAIDGQSTADMSVDEAVTKIRGKRGTQVTLTIYRSGHNKTFDVIITRETISVKSVKWEYKTVNNKNVAIINISRFGDDTNDLFGQAINDVLLHHVDGVVLDLRNDPGGYLESAVQVAGQWVPKNQVVVTEAHSDGSSIPYNSAGFGRLSSTKTVVLINGGSASAAEILAGALRDYNIAQLIGEKSFGKGSVQQLIDLPGDSAVKVTIAKWITPSGKNLNHDGLTPDIEVKLSEDDMNNKRDPQLDRALEEVTK